MLNILHISQAMLNLASLCLVRLPNIDLALASAVLNVGDPVVMAVRVVDLNGDGALRELSGCGHEGGGRSGLDPDQTAEGLVRRRTKATEAYD